MSCMINEFITLIIFYLIFIINMDSSRFDDQGVNDDFLKQIIKDKTLQNSSRRFTINGFNDDNDDHFVRLQPDENYRLSSRTTDN